MTAPAPNKSKSLASTLLFAGMVIVLLGLAYLFLTPKTYQSATRLKIIDWVHASDLDHPSDLHVIVAESALIRSNALLDQVIQNLGLKEQWAKRYQLTAAPTDETARARLLARTSIQPIPNSTLIEIRVTSDDREETAKIANELARLYLGQRGAARRDLINSGLAGLRRQWDEQAQKIDAAQSNLDILYFQIAKSRATNHTDFYDPDAYDALLVKKVELEGELVARQDELSRLEKMKPEELVQVLSTMDESSALNAPLLQLTKARTDLLRANLDHGADSPEVKNASLVETNLEKRVSELVTSTMSVKRTDLQGLNLALAQLAQKIKHGSTNVADVKLADASYQAALTNLTKLKLERATLATQMQDVASADATRPTGVTVEVIDSAQTPAIPFTPDGRVALGILAVGGFLMVIGLILWLVGQKQAAGNNRPAG